MIIIELNFKLYSLEYKLTIKASTMAIYLLLKQYLFINTYKYIKKNIKLYLLNFFHH